jgi:hypothetical protein
LLKPLPFAMGLKRKKGISRSRALCDHLPGPRLLGRHGAARGEVHGIARGVRGRRRWEERCVGSERILRTLPNSLYRAWARAHRLFHSRINPLLLHHAHTAWQLPHYAEQFFPYAGTKATWESTRVNA